MGLGRGGSFDNAIVLDEYRVLNSDGLRYENEFVATRCWTTRLATCTFSALPLIAAFSGFKSGHAMNNKLCVRCWPINGHGVGDVRSPEQAPSSFHQLQPLAI